MMMQEVRRCRDWKKPINQGSFAQHLKGYFLQLLTHSFPVGKFDRRVCFYIICLIFSAFNDITIMIHILLWSDGVTSISNKIKQYGIYREKMETIHESGNKMYKITVIQGRSKLKYVFSPKTDAQLDEHKFITYYKDLPYSTEDIALTTYTQE